MYRVMILETENPHDAKSVYPGKPESTMLVFSRDGSYNIRFSLVHCSSFLQEHTCHRLCLDLQSGFHRLRIKLL